MHWKPFTGLLLDLNAIGTVWIFALMLIINADVFGRCRRLRERGIVLPVPGVPEFVRAGSKAAFSGASAVPRIRPLTGWRPA